MRKTASVSQRILGLSFYNAIELMLLDDTPVTNVAKFIQQDQKELGDIRTDTLISALSKRKQLLREEALAESSKRTKRWFETSWGKGRASEDDNDGVVVQFPNGGPVARPDANIPSVISRNIYDRHMKSINELIELEALYRSQRHRIDRLVTIEDAKNGHIEGLGGEYRVAKEILMSMIDVKESLIKDGSDAKFREQLDVQGYSEETTRALLNPETRHRVVSIVEKFTRLDKKVGTN